jgi:hypothetical protein
LNWLDHRGCGNCRWLGYRGNGRWLGFGDRRRLGRGRRRDWARMKEKKLFLEKFGGDLIQRARRDASGGNAQLLGLGKNFFVLQAEFLRNVVNTNGHN